MEDIEGFSNLKNFKINLEVKFSDLEVDASDYLELKKLSTGSLAGAYRLKVEQQPPHQISGTVNVSGKNAEAVTKVTVK